ncbi:hypothetical protein KC342_g23 [Hortaea werneckii]|nr:hypothetical protein KC342_g23 [Hortaea werneckii]
MHSFLLLTCLLIAKLLSINVITHAVLARRRLASYGGLSIKSSIRWAMSALRFHETSPKAPRQEANFLARPRG